MGLYLNSVSSINRYQKGLGGFIDRENTTAFASSLFSAEKSMFKAAKELKDEYKLFTGSGNWDDESFAKSLETDGTIISTEKTINWSATGSKELTEEQVAYLRENYDIDNMTAQDYYDLMSDLTNMDVISAKDIHVVRSRPMVLGMTTSSVGLNGLRTLHTGNLLENLEKEREDLDQLIEWIGKRQMGQYNTDWKPLTLEDDWKAVDILNKEKAWTERLETIYNKIKGN